MGGRGVNLSEFDLRTMLPAMCLESQCIPVDQFGDDGAVVNSYTVQIHVMVLMVC